MSIFIVMGINTTIGEYSVIQRLGQNRAGGRYTWLAEKDGQQFVVKQFSFSKDANWDGFKALEREVEILKSLDHPQIPKYVDFFDTPDGWCLVQEYIDADSLAGQQRSLDQVKDIAIQVLRILVYLQNLNSPLIHRDIKPENLLQTKDGTVYLVDFGFSRAGFDDLSASSVMLGTVGFMPPEYMFGGPPTKAADLYSLGATLICLLTGTPTHRMGELIEDFAISPKAFERCQDEGFKDWLIKLTKMRVTERFQDAEEALGVLSPSVLLKTPDMSLRVDASLEYFVAKDGTIYNPQKLREKIEYLQYCLVDDPHKLDDQRRLAYLSEMESEHYNSTPDRLRDIYSIPQVQQKIHSLSLVCQKNPADIEAQLSLEYFGDIYKKLSNDNFESVSSAILKDLRDEPQSIELMQWSFKALFSLVPLFMLYFAINFLLPQINLLCKLAEVGECIPSTIIRR